MAEGISGPTGGIPRQRIDQPGQPLDKTQIQQTAKKPPADTSGKVGHTTGESSTKQAALSASGKDKPAIPLPKGTMDGGQVRQANGVMAERVASVVIANVGDMKATAGQLPKIDDNAKAAFYGSVPDSLKNDKQAAEGVRQLLTTGLSDADVATANSIASGNFKGEVGKKPFSMFMLMLLMMEMNNAMEQLQDRLMESAHKDVQKKFTEMASTIMEKASVAFAISLATNIASIAISVGAFAYGGTAFGKSGAAARTISARASAVSGMGGSIQGIGGSVKTLTDGLYDKQKMLEQSGQEEAKYQKDRARDWREMSRRVEDNMLNAAKTLTDSEVATLNAMANRMA